jgi:hypothetical protein
VRDAVARAAGDDVEGVDVEILRDFDAVALVFGRLDVELAAGGGEDGRDGLVVCLYGTTGSAKGIDQDLDAFPAL